MIRLGLCCKFIKEPIKFKTTTVAHLNKLKAKGEDPLVYLHGVVDNNISSLDASLDYCIKHGIGSFRVGSDFLPAFTHPDTAYTLESFDDGENFIKRLAACKEKATKGNIRLGMHPSQFVLLSSPNEEVTRKAVADLAYHAYLCELFGGDTINIHVGGAYGDKKAALQRVKNNVKKLPENILSRLTFENDDKTYSPEEVISLCKELSIPFVYDVHHHRCLTDSMSIEEATDEALTTWNREPLFHLSSPLEGWEGKKPHRHHDYIDPADFPDYWKSLSDITVEVEAKAKELAVFALQEALDNCCF